MLNFFRSLKHGIASGSGELYFVDYCPSHLITLDFVPPLVLCYVHGAANVRLRVEDKIIRQSMIYMIEVCFLFRSGVQTLKSLAGLSED